MDLFEIPVGDPQESTCSCRCGCEVPLSGGTCVDCGDGTHQNNNDLDEFRTCESVLGEPHGTPKLRTYKYGWNGYENAYEGSEWLCDDCYEAMSEEYV